MATSAAPTKSVFKWDFILFPSLIFGRCWPPDPSCQARQTSILFITPEKMNGVPQDALCPPQARRTALLHGTSALPTFWQLLAKNVYHQCVIEKRPPPSSNSLMRPCVRVGIQVRWI